MNALIPRATVEEIVGWRDQAVALYTEAFDLIAIADAKVKEAHAMVRRAAPTSERFYDSGQHQEVQAFYGAVSLPDKDQYLRVARRITDARVWAYIIERTELERLMDKEAKDKLHDQMRYVPERVSRDTGTLINQDEIDRGLPPVTVDNVTATLEMFRSDADMIWRRGVANVFSKLDRRFRSHDGWKIGSRIILSYFCDSWGWISRDKADLLLDIERAFMVLDGQKVTPAYMGAMGQVEFERRGKYDARQSMHETDYFRIRIFKNGNAHLWMVRDDLVEKVNKVLGEYYGNAIGDQENVPTDEDVLRNPTMAVAKNFAFFPTPPAAAEALIKEAMLIPTKTGVPLTILEPSAGSGNLARLAAEPLIVDSSWEWDDAKHERVQIVKATQPTIVDCVELHGGRADALSKEGIYRRVVTGDFLRLSLGSAPRYDRVIMNPPFDRERDIDHVYHALDFLKPDGVLVSIMSAGTEFRETRKSIAFRKMVEERGGWYLDLPDGSFAESGTYVNTIICVIGRKKRSW